MQGGGLLENKPRAVLEEVWKQYHAALRACAAAVAPEAEAPEDILQEAYLRAVQAGRSFPSAQEAFHYLRRVVISTAIDHVRKAKRRPEPVAYEEATPYFHSSLDSRDPLDLLIREEEASARIRLVNEVHHALHLLPEEQRQAIAHFFAPDGRGHLMRSCQELGIPYSTLRSRMLRGIDNLRRILSRKPEAQWLLETTPRESEDVHA
ncbi:MAG: sigma-70 family RNA polymerase sigma factor [Acidobacteriota bacterium]